MYALLHVCKYYLTQQTNNQRPLAFSCRMQQSAPLLKKKINANTNCITIQISDLNYGNNNNNNNNNDNSNNNST